VTFYLKKSEIRFMFSERKTVLNDEKEVKVGQRITN